MGIRRFFRKLCCCIISLQRPKSNTLMMEEYNCSSPIEVEPLQLVSLSTNRHNSISFSDTLSSKNSRSIFVIADSDEEYEEDEEDIE